MKVTDLTGDIYDGMWNYEPPFPPFHLTPLPDVPWVKQKVYCEIFEGLHSQTGTYLETPAHFFGNDNCYLLSEVPAEKLYQMPCRVLMVTLPESPGQSRPAVTSAMLEEAAGQQDIPKGCALLVGTGWGVHWRREDYLEKSPYFTYDAMHWLIEKKPFLLGSDFPRWENLERPQNFFSEFYRANILMLAPLINLEKLKSSNVLLTALPLKVPGTSCAPCRAVAVETEDII